MKEVEKGNGKKRERKKIEEWERKCERRMDITFLITLQLTHIYLYFLEFLTVIYRFLISRLANAITMTHISWSNCEKVC